MTNQLSLYKNGEMEEQKNENLRSDEKMEKKDLLETLDLVFDHYMDAILTDEDRKEIETGYIAIKEIVEQSNHVKVNPKK